MDLHPNVNDPVVLRDQSDREYPSRIWNLGVGLLVVTQPNDLPADAAFGAGTVFSVIWTDEDRVVRVLPARIMATHVEGTQPVWSLFVTGPAFSEQRRRHVRMPAEGSVLLRSAEGNGAVTGSLVDLSEGGVQCTVEVGSADQFLTGSSEAVAEFRFGTVDFAIPGRVEFLRSTARPADFEALVVVFDEPVPDVEALREQLAAAEELQALQTDDAADAED